MMRKGFTLVELLIVIIIIGILATMAVPQYNKMVIRAQRGEAITNLGSLASASILYYTQNSTAPVNSVALTDLDVTNDTTRWTYANDTTASSTSQFAWKATKVNATNQAVRVKVVVPAGTRTVEYSTDGGTAYIPY